MTKSRRILGSIVVLCISGIFGSSASAQQAAGAYTIDNSHTSVIFSISHLGYSYCYGRFNKTEGTFSVGDPAATKFDVKIDANSIDTNDKGRDKHLRGPDFFDSKQFPSLTFKSESVKQGKDSDTLVVSGKLSMHGQTKDIELEMRRLGSGKGPGGKDRTGFFLQKTIKRSDYGMTGMTGAIGDDVSITISIEGIKK